MRVTRAKQVSPTLPVEGPTAPTERGGQVRALVLVLGEHLVMVDDGYRSRTSSRRQVSFCGVLRETSSVEPALAIRRADRVVQIDWFVAT